MQYKKGLRVKNPYAPDWGVGEVLEDTAGNTVSVFFVDAGQKTLSLKDLELVKVDGEEANHPILDNLKIVVDEGLRFRSLPESIQRFLKEYPGGFYGEKFAGNERDYKVNAHRLMGELLNKDGFKTLLAKADYDEICRRALKVVNSTNLIFPNEKMALKDGLNSSEDKRRFSEVLYSHLFGESDLKKRFMRRCREHCRKGRTLHSEPSGFVRRTVQRHGIHGAARDESPHMDLSHSPFGDASAIQANPEWIAAQRPV
jgi:Protein of unknown function (DUF3553)